MGKTFASARTAYFGSNGGDTRRLLGQLEKTGPLGRIAAHLFRAQKASSRAKVYRGGIRRSSGTTSYRGLAYEKKSEAISSLCEILTTDSCGLIWGWKPDCSQRHARFVVYVELPKGQCSFHSPTRHQGPDFDGQWDGAGASEERIIEFCEKILGNPTISQPASHR